MERVVIVHGTPDRDEYFDPTQPSASNAHWLPWLQNNLLTVGFDAQTPEIPDSYAPKYETWRREFERYIVDGTMSFVGHSCGGGFLVRWLSENPRLSPRIVILVAPWLDPNREKTTDFFDFSIDSALGRRTKLVLFSSTNDLETVQDSVRKIRTEIPGIEFHEFENFGHFCFDDMGGGEFPELLDTIVAKNP